LSILNLIAIFLFISKRNDFILLAVQWYQIDMLTRIHVTGFKLVLLDLFHKMSFISGKPLLVLSQCCFTNTKLDNIILLRIWIFQIMSLRWPILIFFIINARLILNLNKLFLWLSNWFRNPYYAITLYPNLIILSIIRINESFISLWRATLFRWFRFLFFSWKPLFLHVVRLLVWRKLS